MSKPQMASEPSMEEILASIRKMIADDKPGPNPLPDTMGRTPFGDTRQALAPDNSDLNSADTQTPARANNSLTDALKVATALSDQRRSLQQDLAAASDKAPRNNLEALTELTSARGESARNGSPVEFRSARPAAQTPLPFGLADEKSEGEAPKPLEQKSDLLSFDFGTMVPQRHEGQPQPKPQSTDTRSISLSGSAPEPVISPPAALQSLTEAAPEPAPEPGVLRLRVGSNNFNGSSGPNVAPFPRPARENAKPVTFAAPASAETADASPIAGKPETPSKAEALPKLEMPFSLPATNKPDAEASELEAKAEVKPEPIPATSLVPSDSKPVISKPLVAEPLTAGGEALLDAVVDLVQQQPGALSVFASSASFVSGVNAGRGKAETLPVVAQVVETVSPDTGDAPQPAKLDRAAAELLRPMLRQWLAENMERILEDALRSELTAQIEGGKGPAKS